MLASPRSAIPGSAATRQGIHTGVHGGLTVAEAAVPLVIAPLP